MLSQRYVDLLDCSELIQDLKKFSFDINEIANSNERAIKNSYEIIKENKPNGQKEEKGIRNSVSLNLNKMFFLEMMNRHSSRFAPIEKLFLLSSLGKLV
jgi:hypothetical protein